MVRGALRRMAPATLRRGRVGDNPWRRLADFVRDRDLGEAASRVGFPLDRDPDAVAAPDGVVARAEHVPPAERRYGFVGAPANVAVEALSPSHSAAQRSENVLTYRRPGVRSDWALEPVGRAAADSTPDRAAGPLLAPERLGGSDVLASFTAPVADVFA
ncbi:MAG: Uma2 family endonuclease [Thermomicrobiales bacterium]|nr:Uma2 family endonuclease [Thermomicrobiales bacterium]